MPRASLPQTIRRTPCAPRSAHKATCCTRDIKMAVPSWLEIDLGEPETSPAASPPAWQSQFFHWLAAGAAALVILIALGVVAADAWRVVDRGPEHRQVLNALRGRFTTDVQKVYYHKMSFASALTFICCGAALLAWLRNRRRAGADRDSRPPPASGAGWARRRQLWCCWPAAGSCWPSSCRPILSPCRRMLTGRAHSAAGRGCHPCPRACL